ncbi:MAG: hypothetical protein JNG90_15480 [Planctomycetaceae bacterium]|nr:hypothetical protein [Planctomycetaceae bacterium]
MPTSVYAVGRPELPPFTMPDRFRHDIAYFMCVAAAAAGDTPLAEGEYRISLADAAQWLADGVFSVVSPLDSASHTEVELTEEQEAWLEWIVAQKVDRVRLG